MDYQYYEKAQKKGFVLADFDFCNTLHIYNVATQSCLCGRYKGIEPETIFTPLHFWENKMHYWGNAICGNCERIIKG